VLVVVAFVLGMPVAIVDVVNVIPVLHCLVAAVRTVLVVFEGVLCSLVIIHGETPSAADCGMVVAISWA
jgi:hypothetical protein